MCGQFHLTKENAVWIRHRFPFRGRNYTTGNVYPGNRALLLMKDKEIFSCEKEWGFDLYGKRIINARSETASEKKLFKDSLARRRCLVVADAFYEWDAAHQKVTFYRPEERMYLGGAVSGDRFVILTQAPNDSVSPVHDRMPVVLREAQIQDWFEDNYQEIIQSEKPGFEIDRPYHQQALF
ncbi:MAG: SOS response-associated peptidase [Catenisphaera adipataccumulans]|jgi:putative SOS response-associated peptidase YedK|uniref:SOS response-associated peptidase n=1 Tax=Catenisphaera adipataccumulans TaxID=700500 RepID=UPI003D8E3A08